MFSSLNQMCVPQREVVIAFQPSEGYCDLLFNLVKNLRKGHDHIPRQILNSRGSGTQSSCNWDHILLDSGSQQDVLGVNGSSGS